MTDHIKQFEKLLEKYPYNHEEKNTKAAIGVSTTVIDKTISFIHNKIVDMEGGPVSRDVQNLEILIRRMVIDENPGPLRVVCKLIADSIYADYNKEMMIQSIKEIFSDSEDDEDDGTEVKIIM